MTDGIARLAELEKRARLGGGEERLAKQHAKGKLSARERIELLADEGSFVELDRFVVARGGEIDRSGEPVAGARRRPFGDGVVTGHCNVNGRLTYLFSQDFTVFGGSLAEAHAAKIVKVQDLAMRAGAPIVGLNDSGGARIQEGVISLAGYADIFFRNTRASGVVPQISAILGPCAGGAVYSPAITDFVHMVRGTGYMFVTGPDVVRTVTHEEIDKEGLGGADLHAGVSGVAHFAHDSEAECLDSIRRLLSYLPQNNAESAPRSESARAPGRAPDSILSVVPKDPTHPYDMREVIGLVVDRDTFFEVHAGFARNLIVGFARLGGHSVGVVANQPAVLAGVLDIDSSDKGARFVRFCDSFNIPLVVFEDVPGFLPGTAQEHGGIIRHGAKLLYAFAEATVPRMTVITRKAYGGAYDVMNSKHIGGDLSLAWPQAEIAVMGPDGAVEILFRKEIASAEDPAAVRRQLTNEYRKNFAHPYLAAARGYIDDVIDPRDTRLRLVSGLDALRSKQVTVPNRKHGNIPL